MQSSDESTNAPLSWKAAPEPDASTAAPELNASELRALAVEAGADDVAFVEIGRPELAGERAHIENAAPWTRTLISFVCRMNREPIRSRARSLANLEFHHTGDHVNEVARRIVRALQNRGVRALNPSMGFPMEMQNFPGRIWVVSHKEVAVAAGLGRMGIHRNVIHPKFGNFILLGTVLIDADIGEHGAPIHTNPCLECKLCVAACPVGAIGADGTFNFGSCYTHNYREFMGGFTDWVETVADIRSGVEYRSRVSDDESASMWQSLGFGPNYKAAYCMAVCPAGEDVIGPYRTDKPGFLRDVVKPLQEKEEKVYVVPDSDAAAHVAKRFPHKTPREVSSGLRPWSITGMLASLDLLFSRTNARDLHTVYHFTFTGSENVEATIGIDGGTLRIEYGHIGKPDMRVTADADTWLAFVRKERRIAGAILTGKIRMRGNPKLLLAFGRCFPS
ncbi:MAG: 4Fe-4S ferredoxin [Myxococcales bacterium]|nr:MAG: 4Fe-4S ferredoxin [Myxococcales bacterium]